MKKMYELQLLPFGDFFIVSISLIAFKSISGTVQRVICPSESPLIKLRFNLSVRLDVISCMAGGQDNCLSSTCDNTQYKKGESSCTDGL